ncbi:MAG: hypothetical protein PHP54_00280 [Clostridia bacterium]|nr:hypothetical protein [Clostridia bacterium]
MEEILERASKGKDIILNKELNLEVYRKKEEYERILSNVINSGLDYAIKGLNVSENFKNTLQEVRDIFKKKDFKNIISSSLSGSLKEGLDITKDRPQDLKNIDNIKNNSIKGGINFLLSAGIDIVLNKFLKGNLFLPQIKKVLDHVKGFLGSNSFLQKIDSGIRKLFGKKNKFNIICENWYKAYEKFSIKDINNFAGTLNRYKSTLKYDKECMQQNSIIQNMTKLINSKKDKLSQIQLQICNEL